MRLISISSAFVLAVGPSMGRAQDYTNSAPSLRIEPAGPGLFQLAWPHPAPGFVLVCAGELSATNAWQPFPQVPFLENTQRWVWTENAGGQQFFRLHNTQTNGLPPEPASVAPPVTNTVATTVSATTEFLYTGTNALQTGVTNGTMDPARVSVVRGRVTTRDGAPLSGVCVTLLDHPELGSTLSRADGRYDLAINGGGVLTLNFEKTGYIPAQRQVNAPWKDYVEVPDVALVGRDPQVTLIDFTSSAPVQVAQGSMSADADGARRATLMFFPGTEARIFLPGGGTKAMTNLNVRFTEYTVGPNGPAMMPAELPPSIGYTYCVELGADEVVEQGIKVGGKDVLFSQPVIFYLDNFLGFPVGGHVPAGYYDDDRAVWVPCDDGKVIKILSVAGGLAELDTDGDEAADDATQLAALGISEPERAELAALYPASQSLWRVPLLHFSNLDCNWPHGPPPGAVPPYLASFLNLLEQCVNPDNGCPVDGHSVIGAQNQTLGESVAIAGTPFRLEYSSDRVPGRRANHFELDIPVCQDSVPAICKRIDLQVRVAGNAYAWSFPAVTNQSHHFVWDGRDVYGRKLQGPQPVTIRVGNVYQAVYMGRSDFQRSFGQWGDTPFSAGRGDWVFWQEWQTTLGAWDARGDGLGGWSLDIHHAYDTVNGTLFTGRGETQRKLEPTVSTTAGGDQTWPYRWPEDEPATTAYLRPVGVAVGPDGSIYIANEPRHLAGRVQRVKPDGNIVTVAGSKTTMRELADGGWATNAYIFPMDVAVTQDGTVYFAEDYRDLYANTWVSRIRRVDTNGIITTVAGSTNVHSSTDGAGFNGESGPATQILLLNPGGITFGPDGCLYIADSGNSRIRRLGPDGILTTVAGGGTNEFTDGVPALQAMLHFPTKLAFGPDGSLYIADIVGNQHNYGPLSVRRITPDGIMRSPPGLTNFLGGSGANRPLAGLAVDRDGSLYVADGALKILRFSPYGSREFLAGNGVRFPAPDDEPYGDGGPASEASFFDLKALALGPDGALYAADYAGVSGEGGRIRRIAPPYPRTSEGLLIASQDGQEGFLFDAQGRHQQTLDALTGALRYQFEYDAAGLLVAVEDGNQNRTVIERLADGTPTAIVAPFGQRTALEVNADGWLTRVIDPAGQIQRFEYSADGLLTARVDARANRSEFAYDAGGRLIRDANNSCCFSELARMSGSNWFTVALTSGEGRQTSYRTEFSATGEQRFVNTFPDGTANEMWVTRGNARTNRPADGTVAAEQDGGDPRFGMQAPFTKSLSVTTPGGLAYAQSADSRTLLTNQNDPFDFLAITNTVTVNGKTTTNLYDAATRMFTRMTPEGRASTTTLDAQGRPVLTTVPGIEPASFAYDAHGRLHQTSQGTRRAAFGFDPLTGFLAAGTNALGEITRYERDAVGRATNVTFPDGSDWAFAWDGNGNLTALTEPNHTNVHHFTYTTKDLLETYRSPLGAVESFTYNRDKELIRRQFPSGQALEWIYAANGQLAELRAPEGTNAFGYHPGSGLLARVVSAAGQQVDYDYDGSLLTRAAWSGVVTGAVQYAYNNDLQIRQMAYAGVTLPVGYDRDGLVTNVGSVQLRHNATNGLLTRIADGGFEIGYEHNEFGEVTNTVAAQGTELYRVAREYDLLGRITRKVETIEGETHTWDYAYDPLGQLIGVQRDGVLVEAYTYDAVGNRIGMTNLLTGQTLTDGDYRYDADHKLLEAGDTTFTYDPDGRLQTETRGTDLTTYHYNTDGTLAGVDLPDGRQITYLHDSRGRRIARAVDGVRTHAWLHGEGLMPLAEFDGNGALRTTFIYAGRPTPVAFVRDGVTNHIVSDHLGSPRLVLDASGTVLKRVEYDSFANVLSDSAPAFDLPFGFAGGMADPDHSLIRFGARDYSPSVGRWTAKDPILFGGGALNLYEYAVNDPVNRTDRSGRQSLVEFGLIILLIGMAIVIASSILANSNPCHPPADPKPFGYPPAETTLTIEGKRITVPGYVFQDVNWNSRTRAIEITGSVEGREYPEPPSSNPIGATGSESAQDHRIMMPPG